MDAGPNPASTFLNLKTIKKYKKMNDQLLLDQAVQFANLNKCLQRETFDVNEKLLPLQVESDASLKILKSYMDSVQNIVDQLHGVIMDIENNVNSK